MLFTFFFFTKGPYWCLQLYTNLNLEALLGMRASLTTQVVPSIEDQPCVNFYRLHPTLGKLIFCTTPHSKFMSTGFSGALAFYRSPAFNGLNKSWDTKNIWVHLPRHCYANVWKYLSYLNSSAHYTIFKRYFFYESISFICWVSLDCDIHQILFDIKYRLKTRETFVTWHKFLNKFFCTILTVHFLTTYFFFKVNGPLQLGGASIDLQNLARSFGWKHVPTNTNFMGCISNFTYNDFVSIYKYNFKKPHPRLYAHCTRPKIVPLNKKRILFF